MEKPKTIGPYGILERLGKGGMGEVYLAKDPVFGRRVALKRIRPDLKANRTIQQRFLREAKVASSLSHPSIVPILSIQADLPEVYYTMPVVEGETLKQILQKTKEQSKKGEDLHPIGGSIPALCRIFLQVCEAIAYTHDRGILHRDLKPENIIVGKYGEVMLLDWGIADFIEQIQREEPIEEQEEFSSDLTRPGKIAGTLAYMAPERLFGKSSSVQTDIYALGVILYQMLTLHLPFHRKTVAAFRKQVGSEQLTDPMEMAPYREIPHRLAQLVTKCLAKEESDRYATVGSLLSDFKKYIEGRADWIAMGSLDPQRKGDWQFQENVLATKHIAITHTLDETDWVALMISKQSFTDNVRVEASVEVGTENLGLGFLLSVSDPDERGSLEEGYCFWIGANGSKTTRLFRRSVQVLEAHGIFLEPHRKYQIRIEKTDDQVKLFINQELKFQFMSFLPLTGKHVGFLHKDEHFTLHSFEVYGGSLNATVGCLAVPNAFFSRSLYDAALQEYRRIGQCFAGRTEGREAMFRAGITLIEKGKAEGSEKQLLLALKEFEKLSRTPGAPLEYLGKSLVYQALKDPEEEAKCLELALRRFPKHPLFPMLKEQIIYRIHETSLIDREASYRILLLALRHIPNLLDHSDTQELLQRLEQHWEVPFFIENSPERASLLSIQLAFWLKKTAMLVEMAKEFEGKDEILFGNALFALLELDALSEIAPLSKDSPIAEAAGVSPLAPLSKFTFHSFRTHYVLLKEALNSQNMEFLNSCFSGLKEVKMGKKERFAFDAFEVWSLLLQKKLKNAEAILCKYPSSLLTQESSPLHFVFGAWLYLAKGPKHARAHFSSVLEVSYPPTTALPSHFLMKKIDEEEGWIERAFWWEKKELYRLLKLFYATVGSKPDLQKSI